MLRLWTFHLLVIIIFTLNPFQKVSGLRMKTVLIPQYATVGQSVRLMCDYDLEADELYSVKWYKSESEFYRYQPREKPNAQVFTIRGIHVELETSNDKVVTLKNVSRISSGIYRCEINAEAPSFTSIAEERKMNVIALPENTDLTEVKANYEIGDQIKVNCTSWKSDPAANLSWMINQKMAPKKHLKEFPITRDESGLETTTLGLVFVIDKNHVRNGDLRLKCIATMEPLGYYRSVEQMIVVGKGSVSKNKGAPIQVRANQQNSDCVTNAAWWITAALSSLLGKFVEDLEY